MADDAETDATGDESADDAAGDVVEVELMHGVPVSESRGQRVLHPDREGLVELASTLKAAGYVTCVDNCGIDYLHAASARQLPDGVEPERFEVSYIFRNHAERSMIRVRVQIPESDPVSPSLFALYAGTEAMERETYDMFGIVFEGHPDMSRILMPEHWEGHPLRKDYAMGRIPVQFKEADPA